MNAKMTPEEIRQVALQGRPRTGPPSPIMELDEITRALTQALALGGCRLAVNIGPPLERLGDLTEQVRLVPIVGVQLVEIDGDPEKWVIMQAQEEEQSE